MVLFAKTSCEYLGEVEPLKKAVQEEEKKTESLRIVVEPPPDIEG